MHHPHTLIRPLAPPILLAFIFILGLVACGSPYRPYRDQTPVSVVKIVESKEPPVTLIATDRSTCLVTVQRFRDVRVGDSVYCRWEEGRGMGSVPGMGPAPVATGSGRLPAISPDPRP